MAIAEKRSGDSPKYGSKAAWYAARIDSPGCGDLAPFGGWINDINSKGCWKVDGPTIPIGPTWVSLHAACEMINAAFRVVSQQPGISNSVYLQGGIQLSRV